MTLSECEKQVLARQHYEIRAYTGPNGTVYMVTVWHNDDRGTWRSEGRAYSLFEACREALQEANDDE